MRPPPRFLLIDANLRCNLRCQHCQYWMRGDRGAEGGISADRRLAIIGEFGALSPGGTVVLCGGENMLDLENYFFLTTGCARLGLRCLAVTNGTVVRDARLAERVIQDGPSEITVSLNSHREQVHDRTRGVPGAFRMAVGALRRLLAAREKLASSKPVYAMAVVCEQNYRELDAFYDFVLNDIGADKLKLNFLQPSFGPHDPEAEDAFFRQNVIRDEEELASIIAACDRRYRLNINPVWLDQVRMYHRSVRNNRDAHLGWRGTAGTEQHICNSYERNVMVDLWGNARLCFSTGYPSTALARPGDLSRFWEGSDELRERMRSCNRYCGISHSVRRETATLKPAAHGELAG